MLAAVAAAASSCLPKHANGTQRTMSSERIYKVIFVNQGKLYEIYARNVFQGNLHGFVEVEDLLFDERSTLLVDPSHEKLKQEFGGVKRLYLPMHAVVRIDEVEKPGVSKIRDATDNVTPFPGAGPAPAGKKD